MPALYQQDAITYTGIEPWRCLKRQARARFIDLDIVQYGNDWTSLP